MSIYMGTTKIETSKTASEVMQVLTGVGADGIGLDIEPKTGETVGIQFSLPRNDTKLFFRLPIRPEGIYRQLCRRGGSEGKNMEQAARTAWRQILRWVQAQAALIDAQIVTTEEVFLPYLRMGDTNKTLYEAFDSNPQLLLSD